MRPHAEIDRLADLLERIGEALTSHGERHWGKRLLHAASQLRQNDLSGIRRFLESFGGMGSLTDLYVCPANKHSISVAEIEKFNRQLSEDLSEAFRLASLLNHRPRP